MYRHALTLTKLLDSIAHEVRAVGKEIRGTVSVGIPNSMAARLAVPLFQQIRDELPFVELRVVEGITASLSQDLTSGGLDMAILYETDSLHGFERTPLLRERLYFVTSRNPVTRSRLKSSSIKLDEVATWPLVLPPRNNGIRILLEEEFQRARLKPTVLAEVTGVRTMLELVRLGVASCITIQVNLLTIYNQGDFLILPIREPELLRSAALFCPRLPSAQLATLEVKRIIEEQVRLALDQGTWPGAVA